MKLPPLALAASDRRIPFHHRLGVRLVLTMVGLLAISSTAFGVGSAWFQARALEAQATGTVTAIAQSRAAHLGSLLERMTDQLSHMADLAEMQAIVDGPPIAGGQQRLLTFLPDPILAVERLAVYGQDGRLRMESRAHPIAPLTLPDGGDLQAVRTPMRFTPVLAATEPTLLELILPIWPPAGGDPSGWLRARLYVDSLRPALFAGHGLGESGELYLISPDGRPLLRGRSAAVTDRWALQAAHAPGWAAATGPYRDADGRQVFGTAQPLAQEPEWILVVRVDRDEVLAPLRRLNSITLALALISVTGGGLAALWISQRLTRPITALSTMADSIGDGKWDARVAPWGQDELAVLGRAFNQMADRVTSALAHERWERARSTTILAATPNALISFNQELTITLVNQGAEALLGYRSDSLIGRPLALLFLRRLTREMQEFVEHFAAGNAASAPVVIGSELICRRDGGDPFPAEAWISKVRIDDELLFTLFLADITERKRYEAQLSHLADHDGLTGLYNRRRFMGELAGWLATAGDRSGAVLFIDLDHFKYVNDTLGHLAGDELLVRIANLFRSLCRSGEVFARLGGDEFALLLPTWNADATQTYADNLLEQIRRQVLSIKGQSLTTTASIGIALYPDHGRTAEDLLARADIALYQAKQAGRNRTSLYAQDRVTEGRMSSKLRWESRIRSALAEGRFLLYAQPILPLAADAPRHYELLLRMRDEEGELIPPSSFLEIAEGFGLIAEIDRWVVREAIRMLAAESGGGQPLCLSINLSARSFQDDQIATLIRQEAATHQVCASALVLEITEIAAIADLNKANHFIQTVKQLGCRIAIDDFGVGFSSFTYFKYLPVEFVKIDGSFVRDLVDSVADQHLVRAMAAMAKGLGIRSIAEYVEDGATLALLQEYGVDFAQGYHVGRPRPLAEWLAADAQTPEEPTAPASPR